MSKNKNSQGNVLIYILLAIIAGFIFLKFVGPKLGIKLFRGDKSSIEYAHAEGFPRSLNVVEDFNKTRLVVTNEEELKNAVALVDKNGEVKLPEINFNRKMVLFVTSKTRLTGGYESRIKKIFLDKDDLIVEIRDTEPGETCITTEQKTLPMDLVVLDKTDLSVDFQVVKFVKECN
ncbi:protease complex subunit PrcB family protein [candidate division WWE3 bacterium]|nr:protease complex subunit PrcB family protein [candidate division WWE3 bacterium]